MPTTSSRYGLLLRNEISKKKEEKRRLPNAKTTKLDYIPQKQNLRTPLLISHTEYRTSAQNAN